VLQRLPEPPAGVLTMRCWELDGDTPTDEIDGPGSAVSSLRAARPSPRAATLWNLDGLDTELLASTWQRTADFVGRLIADDIDVPECWYTHGWVVRRLVALQQ